MNYSRFSLDPFRELLSAIGVCLTWTAIVLASIAAVRAVVDLCL